MRWIDDKGRLLGRINLIDLVVVTVVCLVVIVAFTRLTAPYRLAPQYLVPAELAWVEVEIRLPPDEAWLHEFVVPGLEQLVPRSGEPIATIQGFRQLEDGALAVTIRLRVARDQADRLIFIDKLVAPGQVLRIETEGCIVEGKVWRITKR